MTTRALWWRSRCIGFALGMGTLFQATCPLHLTSPEEQDPLGRQLNEQLGEIGIRQVANLVTDTVFFFLDNTLVRLAR